jgi:hypothetical protein
MTAMSGWMDRILAALGLGGRKPEADVSYDPAQRDRTSGRAPSSGSPDKQFPGLPESEPEGDDEARGAAREPGGP